MRRTLIVSRLILVPAYRPAAAGFSSQVGLLAENELLLGMTPDDDALSLHEQEK